MNELSTERRPLHVCEACGNSHLTAWIHKRGEQFLRCRRCGMGMVSVLPSERELFDVYERFAVNYYLKQGKQDVDAGIDHSDRLGDIAPFRQNNRLLDVGCSTGSFLRAAGAAGWHASGIELSPTIAAHCRDQGLDVYSGTLRSAHLAPGMFDVVRASATLEHVPDPLACAAESLRILRSGGCFHFTVPNIDSLMIRLLRGRYRYIVGEHLYYFSRRSIGHMVRRAGFARCTATSKGFDVFTFTEDRKVREAGQTVSTAQTALREREFVRVAKTRPYHTLLRFGYRAFLALLAGAGMGENWHVYAIKR